MSITIRLNHKKVCYFALYNISKLAYKHKAFLYCNVSSYMINQILKVLRVQNGLGAVGAFGGLITGWTCCDVSDSPMVNEKAGSAVMLAFCWGSGAMLAPIIIPFSLLKTYENKARGKEIDVLEYYTYQKQIATGSWRHRSPFEEKKIEKSS